MKNLEKAVNEAVMTKEWYSKNGDTSIWNRTALQEIKQVATDAKNEELTSTLPICDRCHSHFDSDELSVHAYWPTFTLCRWCVDALLAFKYHPYIMLDESTQDVYYCKNELDWHLIHQHKVSNDQLQTLDRNKQFFVDTLGNV